MVLLYKQPILSFFQTFSNVWNCPKEQITTQYMTSYPETGACGYGISNPLLKLIVNPLFVVDNLFGWNKLISTTFTRILSSLPFSIHIKSPVVKRVIKAISFDNSNGRQCVYAHLSWCHLVHCSIEAPPTFKPWINLSVHKPNIWRWQILEHASASCCGFVGTGSGCLP